MRPGCDHQAVMEQAGLLRHAAHPYPPYADVIGAARKELCDMALFVLVHGGWSGAHGFRKVRPLLRAAGHEVFTPSLTGSESGHTSPARALTSPPTFAMS